MNTVATEHICVVFICTYCILCLLGALKYKVIKFIVFRSLCLLYLV